LCDICILPMTNPMRFQLIGMAGVAFLTPIALVQLYDFCTSNWQFFRRKSRRSLLSKYSVIHEDNSSSVDLPKSAAVATWNSIGLQRPMVIAMVFFIFLSLSVSALPYPLTLLGWVTGKRKILYREYDHPIPEVDRIRGRGVQCRLLPEEGRLVGHRCRLFL
jgi:hypothetical protein